MSSDNTVHETVKPDGREDVSGSIRGAHEVRECRIQICKESLSGLMRRVEHEVRIDPMEIGRVVSKIGENDDHKTFLTVDTYDPRVRKMEYLERRVAELEDAAAEVLDETGRGDFI